MKRIITIGQVIEKIRGFILENYLFGYEEDELCNEASFLELGVLDSTGIIELIAFVESEFDIEVLDYEILPENLDSIDCISRFVHSKLTDIADVAVGR